MAALTVTLTAAPGRAQPMNPGGGATAESRWLRNH